MSRAAVLAAAAVLMAGAAQAQRLDIDPARTTSYDKPITARVGEVFASELSDSDMSPFPGWRAEHFAFTGRAGETVTVQVRSDIPTLVVSLLQDRKRELVRGPAKDAPLRVVLPRDGTYFVVVGANGPQRNGKYQLTFGSGDPAPAPVQAAPVQVAQASAPAAQRVDIVAQPNTYVKPSPVHAGQLIASEISDADVASGVDRSAEYLVFTGRAGQVVTAQVRSDIPSLQVHIRSWRSRTGKALAEGPARDAPLRLVLPKDDEYVIVVHTQGPQRFGKYLLSIGDGVTAPPFDPPKPAPVQVAQATPPKPTPVAPKPAAPTTPPPLPVIAGVTNLRAGQVLARPAGKPGAGAETFQLLAGAGTTLYVTANGSGPLVVTLYTPDGARMLDAEGTGSASLEAIAPLDGLYFLTVSRSDAAKPYKLTLAAVEAGLLDAEFRHRVGYESVDERGAVLAVSCWLEPGLKTRLRYANGLVIDLTRQGAGSVRADFTQDGKALTYSWETRVDGDELVRTIRYAAGRAPDTSRFTPFSTKLMGAYRGYLCR